MGLDNPLADRKSQTGAFEAATDAIEAVKNVWQFFRRYPDTIIGDTDTDLIVNRLQLYADLTTGRCKAQGIFDEIVFRSCECPPGPAAMTWAPVVSDLPAPRKLSHT